MRPFLLVAGDFVKAGGMDGANHALASYVANSGSEVHLAALRVDSDLASRANVIFHRVPKPGGSYLLAEPLLDRIGRGWAARVARRDGRVLVNGGNCQWSDINWVHYVHAAYEPEDEQSGWRGLKARASHRRFVGAERTAVRRTRLVIANSERTRRDVIGCLGIPESRVHRVYYGVDADRFRPATEDERRRARAALGWRVDRPCVAFVGALGDRRKGFDAVFSAWQMLCAGRDWDADLIVVGTGRQAPAWKLRAAEANLNPRMRFLGFRDDVAEILSTCDALVAPTRYEAYGRGVQEALCCGLPAFVTRSAGVAEHYPRELEELLIPDPDAAGDLAARLRAWRGRIDGYRDAVASLSRTLRAHTWDRMARQIVEIVEAAA
ncbi:MAG: glycosyltransferase family 4 protein [Candidatus Binataceae bacterium]